MTATPTRNQRSTWRYYTTVVVGIAIACLITAVTGAGTVAAIAIGGVFGFCSSLLGRFVDNHYGR